MKTQGLNFNRSAKIQLEDEKWLKDIYLVKRISINRIADSIGCHDLTVKSALIKFNIPVRSKSESLKGIRRTDSWKKAISQSRLNRKVAEKEKNPNWKGGTTKISSYERGKLRDLRLQAKLRDNFACKKCGVREHRCKSCNQFVLLHIDHIKPWATFPKERFLLDNLQTLCSSCHLLKTKEERIEANGLNSVETQNG